MDEAARDFDEHLRREGWAMTPSVLLESDLQAIGADIMASVADCGERQRRSGATLNPDGTAHHAVGAYPSLDRFLEHLPLKAEVSRYFDGAPFILHAFNPVTVAPQGNSYLHRIHRDVRTHTGDFRMLLNMLVLIDDFTLDNGATHLLSRSHFEPNAPDEARFLDQAYRLVAPKGSVVLFDSKLWHAAGTNRSSATRRALTLSFSRPFVKQQMDYPRFLGEAWGAAQSAWMRQLLGYNAMTPISYDEFYRPRERRLYKEDQG